MTLEEQTSFDAHNQRDPSIQVGDMVRHLSWAGPCIEYRLASIGRTRYKLVKDPRPMRDGSMYTPAPVFDYFFMVHKEPCERCMDHPHTQYPMGYEG